MQTATIQHLVGNTDIYLLDQVMKNRYRQTDIILDAGCGSGRNVHWFLKNGFTVYGIDQDKTGIEKLRRENPSVRADNFRVGALEDMPFEAAFFDHVICSAVLHFARGTAHFHAMFTALVRVLKPGGSLFIRMTSDIGIETSVQGIGDGVYNIPDGSKRFLLTRTLLHELMHKNNLHFLEPLKTVNVDDIRCMSTLVLRKG